MSAFGSGCDPGLGIESCIGHPVRSLLLSLPVSLPLSLMNKRKKKVQQKVDESWCVNLVKYCEAILMDNHEDFTTNGGIFNFLKKYLIYS